MLRRKMSAEQQHECFLRRVQEIPLISSSLVQAWSFYDKTKNSSRIVGATFGLAENSLRFAVDKAQPVRKILDAPIVATSKLACHHLDKLEEKYPIILATPEELMDVGKKYYSTSYVKSGVDTALSVKDYGVSKVTNSKKQVTDVVNGVLHGGQTRLVDVLRLGLLAFDNVMTYSDSLVDRYVTPPDYALGNGPVNLDDDSFAVNRIRNLSFKIAGGLKYKTNKGYSASKDYLTQLVGQLQATFVLLDYAKRTTGWQNEEVMARLASAQDQVLALWQDVQKRVGKYGAELALLNLAKTISSTFALTSNQIFKYSTPYLSDGVEKNVAWVVQYAQDLNDSVAKATKLGDIKDELIAEAKQGLDYAHTVVATVLDRISVYPPASWMSLNFDTMNLFDDDDDFYGDLFDLHHERRRPLNPDRFLHIGLPIVEPRDSNPARSG